MFFNTVPTGATVYFNSPALATKLYTAPAVATVYCTAPARATVYPEWNAGGSGATTSRKFLDLQIPVDPWLNSLDSDYLVMGLLCISKNTNQSKKVLYCTSCGYCFLAQTFIFCLGLLRQMTTWVERAFTIQICSI